jgi:hypothetical protein
MIVRFSFYKILLGKDEKWLEEQMNNKKYRNKHEKNRHVFHTIGQQMK